MNPDEVKTVIDGYKELIKKVAAIKDRHKIRSLLAKHRANYGLCFYAWCEHNINLETDEMSILVKIHGKKGSMFLCETPMTQASPLGVLNVMNRRVAIMEGWLSLQNTSDS